MKQGAVHEHAVPRSGMRPITNYIESQRARLIISEHPDSAYLAVSVDGASTGMFLSEDQILEALTALWSIKRKIRRK